MIRISRDSEAEEEIAERARDVLPAFPFVLHGRVVQLALLHQPVIPAFALVQHLGLGNAAGEETVSIGNFSMRKCVLKKWMEKMKPAASSASSECRMSAMLMTQPGRNRVKNVREPHDQPRRADDGHAPEHGEVIEFLPIGPAVELRLRAFAEKPFVVRHEIAPVLKRGHHRVGAEQRLPEPA